MSCGCCPANFSTRWNHSCGCCLGKDTDEPELLVEEEPELLVEEEPELLVEEELLDEDLVWEEVVVPLDPEERLSCEYESTGDAIRANATADAIAMFRMFFILIRC